MRTTIALQDMIYWMIIGIGFSYAVFTYNDGRIRAFLLFEFAIGMIVANLTISRMVVPIFIKILEIPINFLRNLVISIKLKSRNVARRKKDGSKKARISQKKKKSKNKRRKCT
jgi:hypothetical protein